MMNEVFQVKPSSKYSLSDKNELHIRDPKTVACGTELIHFWHLKFSTEH